MKKHIIRGRCLLCSKIVQVDVLRADKFTCRDNHDSAIADVVTEMTFKIANRMRAHAELEPLPEKSDRSGYARLKGELGKMAANRARILVEKLGKSEAKRQAGKLLESAVAGGQTGQIEYQRGLIAEIEAI